MFKSTLEKRIQTGFPENPNILKTTIEPSRDTPDVPHRDVLMHILKRTDSTAFAEWKTLNRHFSTKYKEFYKQSSKELLIAPRVTTLESRVPLSIIHFNISKNLHKEFRPKFTFKKSKTSKMLRLMEQEEHRIHNEIDKRLGLELDEKENNKANGRGGPAPIEASATIERKMYRPPKSTQLLSRVQSAKVVMQIDDPMARSISIAAYRIQSSENTTQERMLRGQEDCSHSGLYKGSPNTAIQTTYDDAQRLSSSYLLKGQKIRMFSADPSLVSSSNHTRAVSSYGFQERVKGVRQVTSPQMADPAEAYAKTFKPRISSAVNDGKRHVRFASSKLKTVGGQRPLTTYLPSN